MGAEFGKFNRKVVGFLVIFFITSGPLVTSVLINPLSIFAMPSAFAQPNAFGTIIVEKQTIPGGAAGSFTFSGVVSGSISDNGQLTVTKLPGQYTATEVDPTPDFDLTSIVCDDNNSFGDITTRTATFNLESGETVKCTFTDTERGMIIVEKQTIPDGASGSFTFSGDLAGSIGDDGQLTSGKLAPGTYSSTEDDPAPDFDLTSIDCDDNNSSGDVPSRTATFNLEAGETVKCTFTDTERGMIIVEKQTDPDGAAGSFTYSGDVSGTISDNGQLTAQKAPGQYTSTEDDPAPAFDLTSIVCDDANSSGDVASRTATFNLEAGETVKCTFTNTQQPGMIIVEKQTIPDGDTALFTFTGDLSGDISDGQMIVAELAPGTYMTTEIVPDGWKLLSIVCQDPTNNSSGDVASRTATYVLDDAETVTCTFTDERIVPEEKIVGGEILPIDTTALMLAAVYSQPYWLLLVLVPLVATLTLIKLRKNSET